MAIMDPPTSSSSPSPRRGRRRSSFDDGLILQTEKGEVRSPPQRQRRSTITITEVDFSDNTNNKDVEPLSFFTDRNISNDTNGAVGDINSAQAKVVVDDDTATNNNDSIAEENGSSDSTSSSLPSNSNNHIAQHSQRITRSINSSSNSCNQHDDMDEEDEDDSATTTSNYSNMIVKLPQLLSISIIKSAHDPVGLTLSSSSNNSSGSGSGSGGVIISSVSTSSPFHPDNISQHECQTTSQTPPPPTTTPPQTTSTSVGGLQPNDEILQINSHRIKNPLRAVQLIKSLPLYSKLNIIISRGSKKMDGMVYSLIKLTMTTTSSSTATACNTDDDADNNNDKEEEEEEGECITKRRRRDRSNTLKSGYSTEVTEEIIDSSSKCHPNNNNNNYNNNNSNDNNRRRDSMVVLNNGKRISSTDNIFDSMLLATQNIFDSNISSNGIDTTTVVNKNNDSNNDSKNKIISRVYSCQGISFVQQQSTSTSSNSNNSNSNNSNNSSNNNLVRISNISTNSPFNNKLLRVGNVILTINGHVVTNCNDVLLLLLNNNDVTTTTTTTDDNDARNNNVKSNNNTGDDKEDQKSNNNNRVVTILSYSFWEIRRTILKNELQLENNDNSNNGNDDNNDNNDISGNGDDNTNVGQLWQVYYSYEQQQQLQQHVNEQVAVTTDGGGTTSKSSSSSNKSSIKSSSTTKNKNVVGENEKEEEESHHQSEEYIILRIPNTTVTFRLDFDNNGTCMCYNPYQALNTLPLKNNNNDDDNTKDIDNKSHAYPNADADDDECSSKLSIDEARAALELLYQKHIVSVIDSLNYHTWRVLRCLSHALTVGSTSSSTDNSGEQGQATTHHQQQSTTEYLVSEAAMDTFEQQRTMQESIMNLRYSTVQLTSDSSTSCLDVSGRSGRSSLLQQRTTQQQPQQQQPQSSKPSRAERIPYCDYLDDQWGKKADLDVITPDLQSITRKHGVITRTTMTNPQDPPVASSLDDKSNTLSIQGQEEGVDDDDDLFEHELAKLHIAPPKLGYEPKSSRKTAATTANNNNNGVIPKSSNVHQTTTRSSHRHYKQKQHQNQQQRETFGGGKYGNNVDLELNPNRIANKKSNNNTPINSNSNKKKGVATKKESSTNNNNTGTAATTTRGRNNNNHHKPPQQQQRRRAPARIQRRPSFVPIKDASLFDGKKRRESMKRLSGLCSIISDPSSLQSSSDESTSSDDDDDDSSSTTTRSSSQSSNNDDNDDNDDNNSMQRPEPLATSTQLVLYSPEVAAAKTTSTRKKKKKKKKPDNATTTEIKSLPLTNNDEQHPTSPPPKLKRRLKMRNGNIRDTYKVSHHIIGTGAFGTVRSCHDRATYQKYAVKSILKKGNVKNAQLLKNEIALVQRVHHTNVVRIIDVIQDLEYIHIVMEECKGGDLFDRIVDGGVKLDEVRASEILGSLLDAIAYLHERQIVHRDLKAEHVMLAEDDINSQVKIIDFGLAAIHGPNDPPMTAFAGSAFTVAPEVIKRSYGKECDMWSVGIIAYFLLTSRMPFNAKSDKEIFQKIINGEYRYPAWTETGLSEEAKDFIDRLIVVDPRRRMTAKQALNHIWIRKHNAMNSSFAQSFTNSQECLALVLVDDPSPVVEYTPTPRRPRQSAMMTQHRRRGPVRYQQQHQQQQRVVQQRSPQYHGHSSYSRGTPSANNAGVRRRNKRNPKPSSNNDMVWSSVHGWRKVNEPVGHAYWG